MININDLKRKIQNKENVSNEILEVATINQDGFLVVSDAINLNEKIHQLPKETPDVEKILVHATNFYPKDKKILSRYDANVVYNIDELLIDKTPIRIEVKSQRRTVHFSVNSSVESTNNSLYGSWDMMKFIILEPYALHKKEIVGGSMNDTFTKSTTLSDQAVLIIREDELSNLTEEQKEEFDIVLYKGQDFSVCVNNVIKMLDYPVHKRYHDDVIHAVSKEGDIENKLDNQELFMGFIKFYGKSIGRNEEFDLDVLKELYLIYYSWTSRIDYMALEVDINSEIQWKKFKDFYCHNAIYKKDENEFKFMDYDELTMKNYLGYENSGKLYENMMQIFEDMSKTTKKEEKADVEIPVLLEYDINEMNFFEATNNKDYKRRLEGELHKLIFDYSFTNLSFGVNDSEVKLTVTTNISDVEGFIQSAQNTLMYKKNLIINNKKIYVDDFGEFIQNSSDIMIISEESVRLNLKAKNETVGEFIEDLKELLCVINNFSLISMDRENYFF
ncbi:MAG: hypothetical protein R3Y21_02205 [Mycoplasmatota bacterium]